MNFSKVIFRVLELAERLVVRLMGKGYGGSENIDQEVKAVLSFLTQIPKLAIDVGGNVGDYSMALRAKIPSLEIHIFEPSSLNVAKLRALFVRDQGVHINPIGLSDSNAEAILYSDTPGSGIGSLKNRRLDHFGIEMKAQEKVRIICFEDYWSTKLASRTIDIAKLDIEGFELAALRGFGKAIHKTRVVQFEFGGCNLDTRTNFQDFYYFFSALNFKIYRITPLGLNEVKKYRELDEIYITTNFVAVNTQLS